MQRERDERDSDAGNLVMAGVQEDKNDRKAPQIHSPDWPSSTSDRPSSDEIFVFRPGTAVTIVTDVKG